MLLEKLSWDAQDCLNLAARELQSPPRIARIQNGQNRVQLGGSVQFGVVQFGVQLGLCNRVWTVWNFHTVRILCNIKKYDAFYTNMNQMYAITVKSIQ